MRISLCMIVRDEAAVLERCLNSIADAVDEIVIVDTGSMDRTKEIAAKFTDRIYDFLWCDDFSAARNFSFSKGTGEYLMWLDADDVLPEEEKKKLLRLKESLSKTRHDTIMMIYDTAFDINDKPTFSYYRERLLRNCPQAKWMGRVHEVIVPFGEIHHADIHIRHRKEKQMYSNRNLRIYEQMLAEGEKLDPREQFYYARELYYHRQYASAAERFLHFLEEPQGWTENKLEACRFCSYCFLALGEEKKALDILLRGLTITPPTGELCCEIGNVFFQKKEWKQAIFWYENALRAEKQMKNGAFVQAECYGYLPCIQLCVCYDRLGNLEMAKLYNDMAGMYQPMDTAVERNKAYFAEKGLPV